MSKAQNLLPLLYAIDHEYGWSQGMRCINHALLAGQIRPEATILELGCGSGQFLGEVGEQHPQSQVIGVDLHPAALSYAQARLPATVTLAQADLNQLPFADERFDLVMAFDVYDQAGVRLECALAESSRVLRTGGHLILRVSAHPWLEGAHDRAFNTGQRYREREVLAALAAVGLVPTRVTYANFLLTPAVVPLRLGQRWGLIGLTPALYTDWLTNQLFATALGWEANWLRSHDLAFGVSLYLLARKQR